MGMEEPPVSPGKKKRPTSLNVYTMSQSCISTRTYANSSFAATKGCTAQSRVAWCLENSPSVQLIIPKAILREGYAKAR